MIWLTSYQNSSTQPKKLFLGCGGTPNCVTIDFDTLKDNTVTLRNRDTTKQQRVKIEGSLQMLKFSDW